uniref:hypothetical protein n=1 Tax=Anaerophaga thermohalophila TaxID=177400 RepID=UPI000237C4DB
VAKKDCPDNYLYVRSRQKAVKEASMNEHFSQHYQEELENIKGALHKKGGTKKAGKSMGAHRQAQRKVPHSQ